MDDKAINDILRSATTDEIYKAYSEAKINTNEMLRPFPDGNVLDERGIIESIKNGLSLDIPIIFGTNRDENKLFLIENERLTRSIFGLPFIKDIVICFLLDFYMKTVLSEPRRYFVEDFYSGISYP